MSDAVGRPDRPLEVTVPAEHAALLEGPAAVACSWCGAPVGAPCKTMDGQVLPIQGGASFHAPRVPRLARGPALADAVADVANLWADYPDYGVMLRERMCGNLADALDALARAAGRDMP